MNDELEGLRKETLVAYFKVLPRHLPEGTEKYHENLSQKRRCPVRNSSRVSTDLPTYLPTYGCTALMDLGRFFSLLIYTQPVGLLGRGISPTQGHYLHTEQHKHKINAHKHP
jgi:hypothetical protein